MNSFFKSLIKFLLLFAVMLVLFSFAMFQGGFLSWFLLYVSIPFFIYYGLLLLYPIDKWKRSTTLSSRLVHAGDKIIMRLVIHRKIPFPIPYMIVQIDVPESLHKMDKRQEKGHLFTEQNLVSHLRELREIFFPWFRRRIEASFALDYVPRGEHQFTNFHVKIGDLFGFIEREHKFEMDVNLVVYPIERQIKVMQYLSSFDGGAVPYYTHQLKSTSVASGVREYIPGDRFSWIDWKQTARQQEIMTKEFDQEKSLEMMMIFNSSGSPSLHPIAFEAGVELALALFEEMSRKNGGIDLVSIGNHFMRFSSEDIFSFGHALRDHFARVQPVYKSPLVPQLGKLRNEFDKYDSYVFITTVADRSLLQGIGLLKKKAQKIVVLYIQARAMIAEEEEKYMQLLRSNGVNIYILSEKQLSFDPIEVRF